MKMTVMAFIAVIVMSSPNISTIETAVTIEGENEYNPAKTGSIEDSENVATGTVEVRSNPDETVANFGRDREQSLTRDRLAEIIFTSKYTEYGGQSNDCQWYDLGDDPEVAGTDPPFQCKGYGGYYIYTYFSAFSAHITVNHTERECNLYITEQKLDFIDKNRKIEWRFANGEPFCIIIRVKKYDDDEDKRIAQYQNGKDSGEELIVRGLQGFERISYNVDTKITKNANVKAREYADEGYRKTIRSK